MKLIEVMLSDSVGILSLLTVGFCVLMILVLGVFFLYSSIKKSKKGEVK